MDKLGIDNNEVINMSMPRMTGYDRALFELRTMTGALAMEVGALLSHALGTLQNPAIEEDWEKWDDRIDELRDKIVDRCTEIMCLQQLRPQDLRWLLGFKRMAEALERIADYACDVAELNGVTSGQEWGREIEKMGGQLLTMFNYVLGILQEEKQIDMDLDQEDDVLDRSYQKIKRDLIQVNRSGKSDGGLGLALLLARTIERMGDHVVNIAEMLLYVETGYRRLAQCQK